MSMFDKETIEKALESLEPKNYGSVTYKQYFHQGFCKSGPCINILNEIYYNDKHILPEKEGRIWYECDVDYTNWDWTKPPGKQRPLYKGPNGECINNSYC